MIKVSGIFSIFYSLLLLSRIYVIAGVYKLPMDPSLIQVGYVGVLIMVAIVQIKENNYKIKKHLKNGKILIDMVGNWQMNLAVENLILLRQCLKNIKRNL